MNILFVHDHKFREINGEIYSPGGLSNEILSRYTMWFDKVTVVGRIIKEDCAQLSYSKITNPHIFIHDNSKLEEKVKETDALIVRLPSKNGYLAGFLANKYRKPYLVEIVGCGFDCLWNHSALGKVLSFPSYFLMRYCVKHAPYALYVTTTFLQNRYPCKGKTISVSDVAIETAGMEVIEKRIEKIEKNSNLLILGTAGAVDVRYKGQEYVIKAIPAIMKATGKDVRYELAGSGDSNRLRRIAEESGVADKVVFMGIINHEKIFEWYDNIDIYIQPCLLEGLSRAIVEAMSRGLPCIAANKGGNPEIVEREYLFSTKNKNDIPREISKCITKMISKESLRKVADRNYYFANSDYEVNMLNAKRSQFYLSFVSFYSKDNTRM